MSDLSKLTESIGERDAAAIRAAITSRDFVVISVADDDQDDSVSALTAELGDFDVLVAFSSEERAKSFAQSMDELFEDDDEVDGIVVEGDTLLDHLPEGFGLLLDPESDAAIVIDPPLAKAVLAAS